MRSSCNLFESINGSTASIIWIFEVTPLIIIWNIHATESTSMSLKSSAYKGTVLHTKNICYMLYCTSSQIVQICSCKSLCSSTNTFVNYLYKTTARDPNMQASGTNTNTNWCTTTNTVHRSQPTTSVPTCSHKGRYCRDSGGPLATPPGHILMTSTNIEIIGFIIIIIFGIS